jgi:hypothetical protein
MTKGGRRFDSNQMLVERTADPSTALGMTKGAALRSKSTAGGENCRKMKLFLLGRPPAVPIRGIGNGAFLDLGRMCNKSRGTRRFVARPASEIEPGSLLL